MAETQEGRNGGTLRKGSDKGNTPGPGRTSNEARRMIREAITPEHVASVAEMAAKGASDDIKLRAFKVLADIGIAKEIEVVSEDAETMLSKFFAALATLVDADEYDRLSTGIRAYITANS